VLPAFHQRLGAVLGDLGDDCEVLYVDDGSTASSLNTGTTTLSRQGASSFDAREGSIIMRRSRVDEGDRSPTAVR
ncbi:hypothetical protein ACV33H_32945, partial [Pseudomonas aeruginosa]